MLRELRVASWIIGILALTSSLQLAQAQTVNTAQSAPLITESVDEGNLVTLQGSTRPEATAQNDRRVVADTFPMSHLFLQLRRPPEQERALEQYINEVQDPASPNFHKWLTPVQFGQTFGVAQQDLDTITRWLQSHGFTVNLVYPSRMVIDFSGTAGQVRTAFHTEIHNLEVNGESHVANMSDPRVPAALAPAIVGIVSLNDFKPRAQHQMHKPGANYTFSGSFGSTYALVPADLATIYNLNPLFSAGISGQGQTIAVIEDTNVFKASDWNTFRSTFGLSSYSSGSFSTVHPAPLSGANNCTNPGVVPPNDAEAILDAEWASAAAPSATILMATCADTTTTFGGLIALQNLLNESATPPAVVSISYGQCETENGAPANAAYYSTYQQAVTEGVSVFVAAGDSGAAGCDNNVAQATHGIGVNAFASTPFNVAVGGTDFSDTYSGTNNIYWGSSNSANFGSALSYIPEIPWNNSCAGSLITNYEGYPTPYGSSGLCNSSLGSYLQTTVAGGGGPSACATGTPSVGGVVGGTCQGWPKPSWQSVFGNPSDGVRDTPDVALFAADGLWSHYYVFCWSDTTNGGAACTGAPSGWSGAGGTSFASPIMAAIQALVNQKAGQRQGNPNPVYYQLGAAEYNLSSGPCNSSNGNGVASTCVFYDVTQGDMDVNCTGSNNCYLPSGTQGVLSTLDNSYNPSYSATTGWDFASGIGSINAANLVNNWPSGSNQAALSITKTHSGNFAQGQQLATYTVTVSNAASAVGPTSGTVTVTDALPSGLTLVSMAGTGWTCATSSCSRNDALNAGASYPAIIVTVNVVSNASSPQVNQVSVFGGGSAAATASDSTIIASTPPVLSIAKTHTGNFLQAQQHATYNVVVSNAVNVGPTSGAVTVTDTLPSGMTLVSMAGTGWTCATNSCSRSDSLNGGASYPAITVTVNVAPNASSPQVNQVSVSGGGSPAANASDSTNVTPNPPVLNITKTHAGNFLQGQQDAAYNVTVSNTANAGPTSGTVTVTDTLPSGLTLVSIAGTGWTCAANSCSRSDSLNGGVSYPAIIVTVNVPVNASSPQVNQVSVSGGGSVAANASDSTNITPNPPVLNITKTHTGNFSQGQQHAAYNVTVSNTANANPSSGTVTVTETVPSGMTLVSMAGTGWTCATNSCSRSDSLNGGVSYPPIIVTVNVASNAGSPQVNQVSVSGGGSVTAVATDSTTIIVPALGAVASFIGTDTTTQGSWHGVYGADGHSIPNDSQSIPSYAAFAINNGPTYTWASGTTDPRALQTGDDTSRIASTWYNNSSFNFDVNFTDGNSHQFALYALDWDSQGRAETIQIVDANTNAVLDTRNISQLTNGIYLLWNLTGHVKVNIMKTGGPNGVISGAFFEPSTSGLSENVSITPQNVTLAAGQQQQFAATVSGTSNQTVAWSISSVNPATAAPGGISSTGLYTAPAIVTPAQVTVKATSADGTAAATVTINLTVGATANFVGTDTTTQGSWHGVYGADGHSIPNDSQSIPSYAAFAINNGPTYTWASGTTDPRALQTGDDTSRIASTWYNNSSFNFDVNFTDGNSHQFALYALDWDGQGRAETIQIVDANTNAVLDTRNISQLTNGIYLLWNLTGHVKINIMKTGGPNGVISGAFFEPSTSGLSENVSITPQNVTLAAGQQQQFAATVSGTSNQTVAWSISSVNPATAAPGGISSTGLYTAPAIVTPAQVTVKATSADGTAAATVTINLTVGAIANFVGTDTTTQGSWHGVYGANGHSIPNDSQSIPGYAAFAINNGPTYTWVSGTTDPRALQTGNDTSRIASTWYNNSSFNFDVNFTDGNSHQLALYALDWDGQGRAETIQIVDANTNAVLDTRNISGLTNGIYLLWNLTGHVKINIMKTGGPNAVVSGAFFN